ncbi:MAG: peptidase S9, partial [Calditrichaeota bacterium]|nr:peptidase S9 [Calditrichota bacterium]
MKTSRVVSSATLLLLLLPAALWAQYFGRNKVKYETFHFQIMHTPHFNVYFYPEETRAALDGARMAERWYTRHSHVFQHTFAVKKPILFYADQPDFQQTNAISEMLSEGTGGVTEPLKDRVVLPFTGILGDDDHVIGHELVHAFQFDIVSSGGRSNLNAMQRLPLWIVEGMAEYFSLGHLDAHTAMWLRDAVLFDDVPTIKDLETNPRYFPYRFGQALLAYVGGRWGDDMVARLFRAALAVGSRSAIDSLLHMPADSLSAQWKRELVQTYSPLIAGKQKPREAGHTILAKDLHASSTNLAPAISPDGRYIAVMSERDIFSIDLWLADAYTGKMLKKLSSSERNFHFDAISFVSSSGTWSPDSKRFATVVYAKGNNELAIFDIERRKLIRQRGFPGVGAMSSPAWSPDGRFIAFSGQKGGISDLYLWDLATDSLIQLTNDRYGQIQPAWSPDGTTIAFATDEGPATDLTRLSHDGLQIGFLNLETGTTKILEIFPVGKHINPQFSPDGASLYFIADPDGFSNIYRLDLATGQVYKVTDVATGVTGLSSHSPALSVAAQTGQLEFSVFEHRDTIVNTLSATEAVGVPVASPPAGLNVAGIIAPAEAVETSVVDQQIWDFDTGLPLAVNFPVTPYHTHL